MVVTPAWLANFNLSIDYFHIVVEREIQAETQNVAAILVRDDLKERLKDKKEPTGPIVALLPLLERPRGVTLAELTDEDIAALREFGIAGQIEVRRRNG